MKGVAYTIVLVVTLAVSLLAGTVGTATAEQQDPETIHGSETFISLPLVDVLTHGCSKEEQTTDTTFDYVAPGDGHFQATIRPEAGDWDMYVVDSDGNWLAGSYLYTNPLLPGAPDTVDFPVPAGKAFTVVLCNITGKPQATLDWTFTFGDLAFLISGPTRLEEKVPVNIVFLGYERGQINESAFVESLPRENHPIARIASVNGERDPLGIRYTYDYDMVFTDEAYEDAFFAKLTELGTTTPPTAYQLNYNAQTSNVLDIADNLEISASAVERHLAFNAPEGVDTTEHTVFFINWFGRDDFKFHVYDKSDEPEPESGFNFGAIDTGKLIAWGGSTPDDPQTGLGELRRVWFHDLSAGPDWRTQGWNLDAPPGKIMPPVWEYTEGGARTPAELSTDLALLTRYVAIDTLFTSSPLFPPSITPSKLPTTIDLDMNVYEGNPDLDGSALLDTEFLAARLQALRPLNEFTSDTQDRDFYGPKQLACWASWTAGNVVDPNIHSAPSCYPRYPYAANANLLVHNSVNLPATLDDPSADYEGSGFAYMIPSDGLVPPWLGMADSNHVDGTQSFIYLAISPSSLTYYGMTNVAAHEYGHHFGLSHPHDGYDFENDKNFGPNGDRYFVWVGDESSTAMSYMFNEWDFGQFDRDNMNRWMAAAYLDHAEKGRGLGPRL